MPNSSRVPVWVDGATMSPDPELPDDDPATMSDDAWATLSKREGWTPEYADQIREAVQPKETGDDGDRD